MKSRVGGELHFSGMATDRKEGLSHRQHFCAIRESIFQGHRGIFFIFVFCGIYIVYLV